MNFSDQQIKQDRSSKPPSDEKSATNNSEYKYELPSWDLVPPAAFSIRRVHRS